MKTLLLVPSPHLQISLASAERFYTLINMFGPDGCWEWLGSIDPSNGYARFSAVEVTGTKRPLWAHRFSFMLHKGEIPAGYVIDHTCSTRSCTNPFHLDAVTQRENIIRSYQRGNRAKPGPKAVNV